MLKFCGDESIDESGQVMNLSGFLMDDEQFERLDKAVQSARGDLPYFHMCEGHHTSHPKEYEKLKKLINRENILSGVSASIVISDHKMVCRKRDSGQSLSYWAGTSYTYLVFLTMSFCDEVLSKYLKKPDSIDYVFEAGHANEGDASFFLNQLHKPRHEDVRAKYRYASHTFVDGKGPVGSVLQLADIFAWHMNKVDVLTLDLNTVAAAFKIPIFANHHGAVDIIRSMQNQKARWNRLQVGRA